MFHEKYCTVLDPTVPCVVHAPLRCPIDLKEEIKKEVDRMTRIDITRENNKPEIGLAHLRIAEKAMDNCDYTWIRRIKTRPPGSATTRYPL